MTAEECTAMRLRLTRILGQLPDTLNAADKRVISDFVEANEFGLALETMVDAVLERGGGIPRPLRDEMFAAGVEMQIGEDLRRRLDEITNA